MTLCELRPFVLSPGSLDDVLMEAIIEERVEFVALILQQNVVMKEFLTKQKLQELYERVSLKDWVHTFLL